MSFYVSDQSIKALLIMQLKMAKFKGFYPNLRWQEYSTFCVLKFGEVCLPTGVMNGPSILGDRVKVS